VVSGDWDSFQLAWLRTTILYPSRSGNSRVSGPKRSGSAMASIQTCGGGTSRRDRPGLTACAAERLTIRDMVNLMGVGHGGTGQ
jgi:hypothetical protein